MIALSFFIIVPLIGILAAMVLPLLNKYRQSDGWTAFYFALGAGIIGVLFLFFARLPLYRQKKFFTFGPRLLDPAHRRLYRFAYCFLGLSVFLLLSLLVKLG